jgi:hypothetical protein
MSYVDRMMLENIVDGNELHAVARALIAICETQATILQEDREPSADRWQYHADLIGTILEELKS